MSMTTSIFIAFVIMAFCSRIYLALRQLKHVKQHSSAVPPAFADAVTLESHQKAAEYTRTKVTIGLFELGLEFVLLFVWTLGGGVEWLTQIAMSYEVSPIWTGLILFGLFSVINGLIDLPFSLYSTFVVEERFGFNRTTLGVFYSDIAKGLMISILLGGPLLALILWLMNDPSPLWWLYVWAVWFGFSMLMFWAYPRYIAPIFNKFEPLEDADLKGRIDQLLSKCGFTSDGVFVMDGSKRSAHGNAYFTGVGANKRIVFFDTLLKSLDGPEIEAVLAHELGHFKRNHVKKRLVVAALTALGGLAVLGYLFDKAWFFNAVGLQSIEAYSVLLTFMLVGPVFTFFLTPITSLASRKHEFEADEYACQQADGSMLITALVKLYEENASTLTPDPWYSAVYDSHPPAPVRIKHIEANMGSGA